MNMTLRIHRLAWLVLVAVAGPLQAASERPVVHLPLLEQGGQVSGEVPIDLLVKTAADGAALRKVDIEIDGQALITFDLQPGINSIQYNWDTRAWPDGRHHIVAVVEDSRGRSGRYRTFVYVRNNQAAATSGARARIEIEDTDGVNDGIITDRAMIRVRVAEEVGAKWVVLYLNDQFIAMMNYPPYQDIIDPAKRSLADGPYVIRASIVHPDGSETQPEPVRMWVNVGGTLTSMPQPGGPLAGGAPAAAAPLAPAAVPSPPVITAPGSTTPIPYENVPAPAAVDPPVAVRPAAQLEAAPVAAPLAPAPTPAVPARPAAVGGVTTGLSPSSLPAAEDRRVFLPQPGASAAAVPSAKPMPATYGPAVGPRLPARTGSGAAQSPAVRLVERNASLPATVASPVAARGLMPAGAQRLAQPRSGAGSASPAQALSAASAPAARLADASAPAGTVLPAGKRQAAPRTTAQNVTSDGNATAVVVPPAPPVRAVASAPSAALPAGQRRAAPAATVPAPPTRPAQAGRVRPAVPAPPAELEVAVPAAPSAAMRPVVATTLVSRGTPRSTAGATLASVQPVAASAVLPPRAGQGAHDHLPFRRPQADTPPAPPVMAPQRPIGRVHVVRQGDTLVSLARRYGTTVQALARVNNVENASVIRLGQRLVVPGGQLQVNGRQVPTDTPVVRERSGVQTMPLRFVVEGLGGSVAWMAPTQTVEAKGLTGGVITITVGSPKAKVADEEVLMDLAAYLEYGRTMVPTRFISQQMDVTIEMDPESGNILIRSNR